MKTEIFTETMDGAAEIIRKGGLVAVPTETVYGLAGNGLNEQAVAEIYRIKGRPEVKPLSLMVHDAGAMERYCKNVPAAAYALAEKFWPGPLTIVLESKDVVPEIVRAGGATVGLRCPDHPMTQSILQEAGVALAAPSANPSDLPSPKTAQEVLDYFDGHIEGIVDGGPCAVGVESTIVDLTGDEPVILREGGIPAQEILDFIREHQA